MKCKMCGREISIFDTYCEECERKEKELYNYVPVKKKEVNPFDIMSNADLFWDAGEESNVKSNTTNPFRLDESEYPEKSEYVPPKKKNPFLADDDDSAEEFGGGRKKEEWKNTFNPFIVYGNDSYDMNEKDIADCSVENSDNNPFGMLFSGVSGSDIFSSSNKEEVDDDIMETDAVMQNDNIYEEDNPFLSDFEGETSGISGSVFGSVMENTVFESQEDSEKEVIVEEEIDWNIEVDRTGETEEKSLPGEMCSQENTSDYDPFSSTDIEEDTFDFSDIFNKSFENENGGIDNL